MKGKILLGAEYTPLEPLALYYLASIAKSEGFDQKIVMSTGPEYHEWLRAIESFQPSKIGLTVYTGNHIQIANFIKRLRGGKPTLEVITGGPHATYFPKQALEFSDYVVVGEGFNSFRRILKGSVKPGLILPEQSEPFPVPLREEFYQTSPGHKNNRIKNVIGGTGCPFNCAHCYNSANFKEISDFNREQVEQLIKRYPSGRFFPPVHRPVKEFLQEIKDLERVSPETKFLFLEDDIFGMNLNWLREFAENYTAKIPYHANMRFEFLDPKKDAGKERIELLKKSGCTGLSFAIECSDEIICKEVLNRRSDNELILRVMRAMAEAGIKVRTYQMIGLPYGATTEQTEVNLEADLKTLELNVRLKEETGLPTFAWASTLAPYPGTKIANYCSKHGHYIGDFSNLSGQETYRIRSILRHPRKWVGPSLGADKTELWLPEEEQENYRNQLVALMNHFPLFAMLPNGHKLAREFLKQKDLSSAGLNKATRNFVYDGSLFL